MVQLYGLERGGKQKGIKQIEQGELAEVLVMFCFGGVLSPECKVNGGDSGLWGVEEQPYKVRPFGDCRAVGGSLLYSGGTRGFPVW